MKRLYTPLDVAKHIKNENFTITQEHQFLEDLWKNRKKVIDPLYRVDKKSFRKKVKQNLYKMEGYLDSTDELNQIFKEMGSEFRVEEVALEPTFIEIYFLIIDLMILYSDTNYFKMKLRNLIRVFGYKRRTKSRVKYMNKIISEMNLKVYIQGWKECDIGEVGLDQIIIFRKKNTTKAKV